jgi:hypothetical protein
MEVFASVVEALPKMIWQLALELAAEEEENHKH